MTQHTTHKTEERRKHKRIRLSPLLIEPISISVSSVRGTSAVPGIIADISPVGMAIIMYDNVSVGTKLEMDFNLLGLHIHKLKGTVSHMRANYNTYIMVISFDTLQQGIARQIETIAMDFEDCETRWYRGEKDFCAKTCGYYTYCSKSVKK